MYMTRLDSSTDPHAAEKAGWRKSRRSTSGRGCLRSQRTNAKASTTVAPPNAADTATPTLRAKTNAEAPATSVEVRSTAPMPSSGATEAVGVSGSSRTANGTTTASIGRLIQKIEAEPNWSMRTPPDGRPDGGPHRCRRRTTRTLAPGVRRERRAGGWRRRLGPSQRLPDPEGIDRRGERRTTAPRRSRLTPRGDRGNR